LKLIGGDIMVNTNNEKGKPLIIIAAMYGSVDVARWLLENGVPVDTRRNNGTIPLHCAADSGNREKASLLLEGGAEITCLEGPYISQQLEGTWIL
jgi:ankyrin repeat protein